MGPLGASIQTWKTWTVMPASVLYLVGLGISETGRSAVDYTGLQLHACNGTLTSPKTPARPLQRKGKPTRRGLAGEASAPLSPPGLQEERWSWACIRG